MSKRKPDPREAVYDEQIYPLMTQIINLCKQHHIPIVAVFQFSKATRKTGPGLVITRVVPADADDHMKFLSAHARPPEDTAVCISSVTLKPRDDD